MPQVAHPDVNKRHGAGFIQAGFDYMCASTTAFADPKTYEEVFAAADSSIGLADGRGLYIAQGALFGAQDIQKMSNNGKQWQCTVGVRC